jgi:hypothetical protein
MSKLRRASLIVCQMETKIQTLSSTVCQMLSIIASTMIQFPLFCSQKSLGSTNRASEDVKKYDLNFEQKSNKNNHADWKLYTVRTVIKLKFT